MSAAAFDSVVTRLDGPLIVVTTVSGDERAGCLVGFHIQCSIEPLRYALWLSRANHTHRVALFATKLALHFLGRDDHDLATLFGATTGDDIDKFARCEWTPGPGGVPLLARCENRIVLERSSWWADSGDHVCVVGEVTAATSTDDLVPLRLSHVQDITAGHTAQERATPNALTASPASNQAELHHSDEATQRELEDAAAGAGHPVDLSASNDS